MLELISITYKQFKQEIYYHYLELFPKDERKTLKDLEKQYKDNILKFAKIVNHNTIGFLIYETIENNPLVLLDYFAIFPEYQNQKYGSKAIEVFKTFFATYDGIYGEIEKNGLGKNEEENQIRARRINFWQNLGFVLLETDLELYKVIYSPCILKLKNISYSEEEIINYAFQIYNALFGEKKIEKNCRILKK